MNCFNHEENVAVAICPICGRGLCKSCSKTFENYIVCGEECLNILNRNKALIDASIIKQSSKNKAEVFFLYLCGGIFGIFGLLSFFYIWYLGVFLVVISAAFIISGTKYKQSYSQIGGNSKVGI